MTHKMIALSSERKIEIGAYFIGALLVFAFKTTVELLNREFMSLLNPAWHIGFNAIHALLVNFIIGPFTKWINLSLERSLSWWRSPVKRFLAQASIITVFAFLIVAFVANLTVNFIIPYADKTAALHRSLVFGTLVALMLGVFYTGVYFFEQWGRSRLKAEQLKRESLQSQFITLKNQVSPHFLFNSLNTLSGLISEDQKRATEFVQNLASVYRYVLKSIDKKVVDLETELQAAQAYVYLQQTRFGENLRVNVQIPDEYKHLGIAPFTLQILLENAIKHNIISNGRPLTVHILVEGGSTLIVKNNLQRKSSVESGTGVGLKNIASRYGLLDNKVIEIRETGSEFMVAIPLLEDNG